MHAIPQHVQKQWDRQTGDDYGAQIKAAMKKNKKKNRYELQNEKDEFNLAMLEQAIENENKAARFYD
jgi:hypothetical protein